MLGGTRNDPTYSEAALQGAVVGQGRDLRSNSGLLQLLAVKGRVVLVGLALNAVPRRML